VGSASLSITFTRTVPNDATIVSGQSTHSITVNWGSTSGAVNATPDDCVGEVLTMDVTVDLPCTVNADCDDGNLCNGAETCSAGLCVAGTVLDCDDTDACTVDSCDSVTGCLYDAITCDDTNACTLDSCDSVTGCLHDAITCDDTDACTADSCDSVTGCLHDAITCDDGLPCSVDSCNTDTGCVHDASSCLDPCDGNGLAAAQTVTAAA
jgi:hypothetical protein